MVSAMHDLLHVVLLRPTTRIEFLVSCALGGLVCILVLGRIAAAMDFKVTDTVRALIVVGISLVSGLAGAAAVAAYVPRASGLLVLGAGLLALAAIAVPAMCFIFKGGYLSGLMALVISLAAGLVLVVFVHTGFNALRGGEANVERGIRHNRETEQFIR